MKEIKTEYIKVRVTASEKERIIEFCEKKGLKLSEFIRNLCNREIALAESKQKQQ